MAQLEDATDNDFACKRYVNKNILRLSPNFTARRRIEMLIFSLPYIQCVQDKSAPVVFVEYLSSVLRLRSPTFIRALS